MTFEPNREVRSRLPGLAVAMLLGLGISGSSLRAVENRFVFKDVTATSRLLPAVSGIRGHGAGWGDVDGDGWLDLYVGTFHEAGSKANLCFRNERGRFRAVDQPALSISTRANGALFVDLDNDGDADLYVTSMPAVSREGAKLATCSLFRNEGGGRFTNISADNGACPEGFMGRSCAALDYDGDGLLDLLVGEDPIYGRKSRTSRLFRNRGGLTFADATLEAGIPAGVPGLGVAAADVTGDGWPDFFLAARDGGNRLFVNDGRGRFAEAVDLRERFAWEFPQGDDTSAGVCFGDVNRDGRPDLLVGQHFKRPWLVPVPLRLYLNRGKARGNPDFEEVKEAAGLQPLPMKAPHVEIQDFDNDGWPDLYTSVVKLGGGKAHPLIYRHLGLDGGVAPTFREEAMQVNDFPTAEDRAVQSTGEFFTRMLRERKITYTAAGPSGDFDNDGRLDLFLASWWLEAPSMLLRNESVGGNWLNVRVKGGTGVNRDGIGARVQLFRAGHAGELASLIGSGEIAAGYGYASSQAPVAHFGLGPALTCDLVVTLPHGKGEIVRKQVTANQSISL